MQLLVPAVRDGQRNILLWGFAACRSLTVGRSSASMGYEAIVDSQVAGEAEALSADS